MNEALGLILILFGCAVAFYFIKWLWALKDLLIPIIVAVILGMAAYEYIISPSLGG
jgi:hypothetical protein|tara:strand:+ start:1283 stop:1450 length:168 start_codon:yes stop_codon:yes gene_type:complete